MADPQDGTRRAAARDERLTLEDAVAAVREETPSLVKMFDRCRATVFSLTTRLAATSPGFACFGARSFIRVIKRQRF